MVLFIFRFSKIQIDFHFLICNCRSKIIHSYNTVFLASIFKTFLLDLRFRFVFSGVISSICSFRYSYICFADTEKPSIVI